VNASTFVDGLIDDVPAEVLEAFVEASAGCLKCVDPSDLIPLGSGDVGCPAYMCGGCGTEWLETWYTCRDCCEVCRCMGCDPAKHWGMCESCCGSGNRRLTTGSGVDFTIDVCMDDVNPLNPTSTYYVDYNDLIEDFEAELKACYENKEDFYNRWSSLCSDVGIDLSTMARNSGEPSTIMFDIEGMDKEGAKITTYSSDESHQSTSNMFFYGALGFVSISVFAVMGTAVVVKVLNKRKEERNAQTAKWVAEMGTVNPVMGSGTNPSTL
jgi:hypothetical protein